MKQVTHSRESHIVIFNVGEVGIEGEEGAVGGSSGDGFQPEFRGLRCYGLAIFFLSSSCVVANRGRSVAWASGWQFFEKVVAGFVRGDVGESLLSGGFAKEVTGLANCWFGSGSVTHSRQSYIFILVLVNLVLEEEENAFKKQAGGRVWVIPHPASAFFPPPVVQVSRRLHNEAAQLGDARAPRCGAFQLRRQ